MEVLIFALKLLIGAMVLMPFAGTLGILWINHYFDKRMETQTKTAETAMKFYQGAKALADEFGSKQRKTEEENGHE